ncbi:S-adenosyl-L-methionine-dependent methyltransferase [Whalleya microplaca]|nr:S-adenosyl-L-methionine-dependent methyltransferase [Whalleya microplaca]
MDPNPPRQSKRRRPLALRPSTARATSSSSARDRTPHNPRSPCTDDIPPPLPGTPSAAVRGSSSLSSPTSAQSKSQHHYALSPVRSVPSGLNIKARAATFDQVWPREDPDEEAVADDGDSEVLPPSPQTMRRGSTKSSSSSRFFRSLIQKFGRSFHRNYFLPHDKQEQDRNNLQHEISVEVHDGNLHLSPIVNPKRVLDIGSGTARRNPSCDVLGIDLTSGHPTFAPPNCHFRVADVEDDWKFGDPFDFIHVRSLGEPRNKRRLFKTIYNNLTPGGAQKLGKSLTFITDYKNVLERVGFDNVTELKYAVPTNAWAPGKQNQKIGALQKQNTLQVIDIFSLGVFTQGLGWSKETLDKLLVDVRKDIENTRIHSYSTLMTVYCRKPEDQSSSTASFDTSTTPGKRRPSLP